jgi:ABC-type transporter MlaC component
LRFALAIFVRPLAAIFILAAMMIDVTVAARAAEAPESARATVQQMLDGIRKLRTTTDQSARGSIILSINDSLALRSLSEQALGAQWGRLDAAERSHFIALLTQLLEKVAYPRAAQFFSGIDIKLGDEASKGTYRIVPSRVKRDDGGEVAITYILERQAGRWRVLDIILDGQSLASIVTVQIQAVMKKSAYSGLIAQMQEQLKQNGS